MVPMHGKKAGVAMVEQFGGWLKPANRPPLLPTRGQARKAPGLVKTALLGGFLFQAQFAYLTYAPGRIFSFLSILRQKTEITDGMSRAANNLEFFPRWRNGFKDA